MTFKDNLPSEEFEVPLMLLWDCLTSAAVMATENKVSASFLPEYLLHHIQNIQNVLEQIVICDSFRVS